MKIESIHYKIIVDSNIWISFLLGKNLNGLHNLIDSKADFLVTGDNDLLEMNKIGLTAILNFRDFDRFVKQ